MVLFNRWPYVECCQNSSHDLEGEVGRAITLFLGAQELRGDPFAVYRNCEGGRWGYCTELFFPMGEKLEDKGVNRNLKGNLFSQRLAGILNWLQGRWLRQAPNLHLKDPWTTTQLGKVQSDMRANVTRLDEACWAEGPIFMLYDSRLVWMFLTLSYSFKGQHGNLDK